jgi:anti-sigma B factor antagonist
MADNSVQLVENRFSDVVVLCPTGRLDQDTSSNFQSQVLLRIAAEIPQPPIIVLDMAGVDYISSIGLRALMIAAKQCQADKGSLVVACLTPVVEEIFEISRFNLIINVFGDVRSAIASVSVEGAESYDAAG